MFGLIFNKLILFLSAMFWSYLYVQLKSVDANEDKELQNNSNVLKINIQIRTYVF